MIRGLLLVLAMLLAGAAPVYAQSDARKLAVFYMNGEVGEGTDHTTGNRTAASNELTVSEANHMLLIALDRMGVPYTIFNLPDSAGGWASTMRATRGVDVADSTWFRSNGYFGWVTIIDQFGSGATSEIFNYFTDAEGNRGLQRGSPIDGNWGIPGVVWNVTAITVGGFPVSIGANATRSTSLVASLRQGFANGDSLSTLRGHYWNISPAEAANVTRIINADSLGDGNAVTAWRYKTSTYYYGTPGYLRGQMLLLGLAQLFDHAGYVPRRKLNLHMTLDHVFPDGGFRTAPSDSFFKYVDKLGLRYSGAIEAYSAELTDDNTEVKPQFVARKVSWPAHPHSHSSGFAWFITNHWNLSTFADSSTKRQRFNFLERAISDTLGMMPAKGYEKTASFAGNGVYFPDAYILAQNGYTDLRAAPSDSTGHLHSLGAGRRIQSARRATTPDHNYALPYRYTDPISGRGIYVHDGLQHPGFADTLWSMVTGDNGFVELEGKSAQHINGIAYAILWDADFYWHPDDNLKGPDPIMATMLRRFTYFYNRVKNIVTIEPSYRPKFPRRSSIPR